MSREKDLAREQPTLRRGRRKLGRRWSMKRLRNAGWKIATSVAVHAASILISKWLNWPPAG